MTPNDLSAYRIPLRADVRMLSDAGLVSEAHDLIAYLVTHDKVDGLEKERLLLEDHALTIKSRDFPYDEAEALALCKQAGMEAVFRSHWWTESSITTNVFSIRFPRMCRTPGRKRTWNCDGR